VVEDVEVVDEVHLDHLDILDHLDTLGCKKTERPACAGPPVTAVEPVRERAGGCVIRASARTS